MAKKKGKKIKKSSNKIKNTDDNNKSMTADIKKDNNKENHNQDKKKIQTSKPNQNINDNAKNDSGLKDKSDSKTTNKNKSNNFDKLAIGTFVLILVLIIGYAIVNIDQLMPNKNTDSQKGTLIASVNGEPIYDFEVKKLSIYLKAQLGPMVTEDFTLNHTINQRLLLQEAKKNGIIVDHQKIKEGVDKWFNDLQAQVSNEQLDAILTAQNITLEEFKNDTTQMYTTDFIILALFNQTVFADIDQAQFINNSPITDEDMLAYYNDNIQFFDRVTASHILICYKGSQTECNSSRTKEEAKAKADELYAELLNNGNFEELAKENSDGPSAPNGGYVGEFSRGQMVKEFEDAAFSLKNPNQISKPIETVFGYHIIKLISKKNTYDDFKNEINLQIQFERQTQSQEQFKKFQEKALTNYLANLRSKADIRYYSTNNVLNQGIKANPQIQTFNVKDNEICTENGKPIIRLYSTTTCPHCIWIKETFDQTVKQLEKEGKIVAYHWELDSNDNTLTEVKETYIPESETKIYYEFNPRGSIPTFVFGCKYYRIGNGYESEKNLDKEKQEFIAIINDLIKSTQ